MSSIVAYERSERQDSCQIKLDSGERVLVSIAPLPGASIAVIRMALAGLLRREIIWEYSAAKAGSVGECVQNVVKMFPPRDRQPAYPLDVIRDALLQCRSTAECRSLLLAREDCVLQASKPDVLTVYASLLGWGSLGSVPESCLPVPKPVIKTAIIELAAQRSAEGRPIHDLRIWYVLLGCFISDEIVAQTHDRMTDPKEWADDFDAGLSFLDLLVGKSEERRRLLQEFDDHVGRSHR
jgi:hypothetical protein